MSLYEQHAKAAIPTYCKCLKHGLLGKGATQESYIRTEARFADWLDLIEAIFIHDKACFSFYLPPVSAYLASVQTHSTKEILYRCMRCVLPCLSAWCRERHIHLGKGYKIGVAGQ